MNDDELLANVLRRFIRGGRGDGYVWVGRNEPGGPPYIEIDTILGITEDECAAILRATADDDYINHANHFRLHPLTGQRFEEASVVTAEGKRLFWCGRLENS